MNWYSISFETNKNITGNVYPQLVPCEITKNNTLAVQDLSDDGVVNITESFYSFQKKTKLTDFLSAGIKYFIVNNKVKNLLQFFRAPQVKFIELNIVNVSESFYVLYCQPLSEIREYFNLELMKIEFVDIFEERETIEGSISDLLIQFNCTFFELFRIMTTNDYDYNIKKYCFTKQIHKIDFLYLSPFFYPHYLINEKLKNKLENENVLGVEYRKVDIG